MTFEFKNIIEAFQKAKTNGQKTVLATVVDLDGSSYRKPGVRMLILENETMVGAVSGGCVEKDILRHSVSVFKTGQSKIMTYDGRFRLGCEGILYILLEVFNPNQNFIEAFKICLKDRKHFKINSIYNREEGHHPGIGTYIECEKEKYRVSGKINGFNKNEVTQPIFSQEMPPCFKLMIFGAEHDAVQLCQIAALNGWEAEVFSGPSSSKTIHNFPGASKFHSMSADNIDAKSIDNQTAIMIMTHSFANDLKYLMVLKDTNPVYLGLLGPVHKRENLLTHLLEFCPEIEEAFLDKIHGPAGLDIGSETPQEIAISIIAEILSVSRQRKPIPLKEKTTRIHV
jgi:xanthine/CO dehydrogenase XdhC/CoxF family maturation factor